MGRIRQWWELQSPARQRMQVVWLVFVLATLTVFLALGDFAFVAKVVAALALMFATAVWLTTRSTRTR